MNFDAIKKAIHKKELADETVLHGNHDGSEMKLRVRSSSGDGLLVGGDFCGAMKEAFESAANILNLRIAELRRKYDAEARGLILEARQEERPDAYLDEIVKAFGPHQGLNANWAVMAWRLGGEVWLCDDENDKTVSIVTRRITTEIDEIVQVASNVTPARALQIWAMISEEGR